MRERMAIDQLMSQLEAEKGFIEDGFKVINRRLAVLDEVEGWKLKTPDQEETAENPATDQLENDAEEEIEWVKPTYPLQCQRRPKFDPPAPVLREDDPFIEVGQFLVGVTGSIYHRR